MTREAQGRVAASRLAPAPEPPSEMAGADESTAALVHELGLQEQACTYLALTFSLWRRALSVVRALIACLQLAVGLAAIWRVLVHDASAWTVVLVASAVLLPLISSALRLDSRILAAAGASAEFAALRDRFRRAGAITAQRSRAELDRTAEPLFLRLERARADSGSPPEIVYALAVSRVRRGRFRPD